MLPKVVFFVILCLLSSSALWSQQDQSTINFVGISAQVYPAGFIATGNLEHFMSDRESLVVRLGFNFTDRKDFSEVNDTEEGGGFGGSFGYRYHFPAGKGAFIAGLNVDVWYLDIDWTDSARETIDSPLTIFEGSSNVLVLQPWLEGGYFLPLKNSNSRLGLTLGFGREINVVTDGDEVAQGFIGSISFQYLLRI